MDNLMPRGARLFLMVVGCICSISAMAKAWGNLNGSGKEIDESRTVEAFHAVEVANGIRLELAVGSQKPLEVHGEDNILPLLVTEVHNGELHIHYAKHTNLSTEVGVTVKVTVPMLDILEASGGSNIHGEIGKSDVIQIEASGGGEVQLSGIDAKALDIEGSGGGAFELKGHADELKLDVSGGTRFRLGKLAVARARISGSGGCDGVLNVTELVRGDLSGGSSLRITGGGHARVSTSGGSSVDVD